MESVRNRFKSVRKELGFNQQQFANELGISQTHVSAIETGRENPSTSLLKLLCAKFSIKEDWLICGVGKPLNEWDMSTDDGVRAKYEQRKFYFEKALRNATGEDLICMVEAFCYLTEALKVKPGKLHPREVTAYRKTICSIIHELENFPVILNPMFMNPKEESRESDE